MKSTFDEQVRQSFELAPTSEISSYFLVLLSTVIKAKVIVMIGRKFVVAQKGEKAFIGKVGKYFIKFTAVDSVRSPVIMPLFILMDF